MMKKWDKGLEFEKTMRRLLRDYNEEENVKRKAKIAILIIQLRNGSRISEAIEALERFKLSGERELEVRVRKKRREEMRKMIIPDEIKHSHIVDVDIPKLHSVVMFARRRYGFNTHSLRYSFITHLAMKGISPQLISKITRHSKLDLLVDYTQEKMAEKVLEELI